MLAYLERIFRDSNRRQNAKYKFQNPHQEDQNFNTFWAKFLHLSAELDQNNSTLISDLANKLLIEVQQQLISKHKPLTVFLSTPSIVNVSTKNSKR